MRPRRPGASDEALAGEEGDAARLERFRTSQERRRSDALDGLDPEPGAFEEGAQRARAVVRDMVGRIEMEPLLAGAAGTYGVDVGDLDEQAPSGPQRAGDPLQRGG